MGETPELTRIEICPESEIFAFLGISKEEFVDKGYMDEVECFHKVDDSNAMLYFVVEDIEDLAKSLGMPAPRGKHRGEE